MITIVYYKHLYYIICKKKDLNQKQITTYSQLNPKFKRSKTKIRSNSTTEVIKIRKSPKLTQKRNTKQKEHRLATKYTDLTDRGLKGHKWWAKWQKNNNKYTNHQHKKTVRFKMIMRRFKTTSDAEQPQYNLLTIIRKKEY